MLEQQGFVKLYRSLVDWEWYTDVNACKLFIHCLIKANYSPKKWQGIKIRQGEFITSIEKLAIETGLTISKVRTAITKLESTGDLKVNATPKYTKVIMKSDYFYLADFNKLLNSNQDSKQNDNQNSKPLAIESQSNDKLIATTKKEKEEDIIKRKTIFRESVFIHSSFNNKILESFFNFWTELNKNGQMRFEGETYWETKKRLQKWASNEKQPINKQQSIPRASLNR